MTTIPREYRDAIDLFINHIPGYTLIKDLNSIFLKACSKSALVFGLKDAEEIAGLKDSDLRDEIARYSKLFSEQDAKLLRIKKPISGFYAIYHDGRLRSYIYNKAILNDKKNRPFGIISQSNEIKEQAISRVIAKLFKMDTQLKSGEKKIEPINYYLTDAYEENLSKLQLHCLFYLLRRKSIPEIATILNISVRSVEANIEQIKNQFGCHTNKELVDNAIHKNYLEIIPKDIIDNKTCILKNFASSHSSPVLPAINCLSPQKRKCFLLLVEGFSVKEIAQILNLSPRTVEHHLEQLRILYCCRNSRELISKYFLLKDQADDM
jgi:DNA-binding CsgD family transcriptional regulator